MCAKSLKVGLALIAVSILLVLSSPAVAVAGEGARSDTTWFGRYVVVGDEYYALPYALKSDAVWTFDRGIGPLGDPGRIDGGEGWAAIASPSNAGIADFACYGATVECLSNNVLETHAGTCDQGSYPAHQYLWLESPICELGTDWGSVFLEYDRYLEAVDGGVVYRFGWRYYPAPGPDGDQWSDRVGSYTYWWMSGADCTKGARIVASSYIPSYAQKVIAVLEIATPDFIGMDPMVTEFPGALFDNFVVGVIGAPDPAGLGPVAADAPRTLVVRPNPSSAGMSIDYRLDRAANVSVEVMDVAGRVIRTLAADRRFAGSRSIWWDGSDGRGNPVGAGTYWVRLRRDGAAESRKVVVTR